MYTFNTKDIVTVYLKYRICHHSLTVFMTPHQRKIHNFLLSNTLRSIILVMKDPDTFYLYTCVLLPVHLMLAVFPLRFVRCFSEHVSPAFLFLSLITRLLWWANLLCVYATLVTSFLSFVYVRVVNIPFLSFIFFDGMEYINRISCTCFLLFDIIKRFRFSI